mmetsp:Transcript_1300/g.3259  ORF Transcript_1300/g.3259 Transcript_1300/m.3259 type:complete len:240 (-) Transcript_1300:447-1166(-)
MERGLGVVVGSVITIVAHVLRRKDGVHANQGCPPTMGHPGGLHSHHSRHFAVSYAVVGILGFTDAPQEGGHLHTDRPAPRTARAWYIFVRGILLVKGALPRGWGRPAGIVITRGNLDQRLLDIVHIYLLFRVEAVAGARRSGKRVQIGGRHGGQAPKEALPVGSPAITATPVDDAVGPGTAGSYLIVLRILVVFYVPLFYRSDIGRHVYVFLTRGEGSVKRTSHGAIRGHGQGVRTRPF